MKINKRVIIVLFAAFISTLSISAISKHPFHVGVVNVSYSPKQKTFQLSFKFFDHDFEQALKTEFKTKVDLKYPKDKTMLEKNIQAFIKTYFTFLVNNTQQQLHYIGYELKDESVWVYLEAINTTVKPNEIAIKNKLLYRYFQYQNNLIHINCFNKRESTKLVYPDSMAVFKW